MLLKNRDEVLNHLGVRSEALSSLQEYLHQLWTANGDLNLFSRKMTLDELIDNHLIDCLLPLKSWPENLRVVADFGTGGGMPGVIYAILFPEIEFHLYEKSPKKQAFLKGFQKQYPNIKVFGDIPKDLPGVDLVIARAFKPIDVILEMSQEYWGKGGRYFLLKGRREKIEEELHEAQKKQGEVKVEIRPLQSPLLEVERHLVLIGSF